MVLWYIFLVLIVTFAKGLCSSYVLDMAHQTFQINEGWIKSMLQFGSN
jgi:hypothetical protein